MNCRFTTITGNVKITALSDFYMAYLKSLNYFARHFNQKK